MVGSMKHIKDYLPDKAPRTFEVYLEDLKEEARQRYLALVDGEPAYGPIAILEIEPMTKEGLGTHAEEIRECS